MARSKGIALEYYSMGTGLSACRGISGIGERLPDKTWAKTAKPL
jgi:hypothetical protein